VKGGFLVRVVGFGLLLVLLISSAGIADGLHATKFDSNGDLIQGWYWIRDRGLEQYAEWTFTNVPPGTDDIVIEITALATDRASGGRGFSARFRLLYGFPGSGPMGGVFEVMEVTLLNVSPPDDPVGYTCKGKVSIPRSALYSGSRLFLRAERISPTDNHVAFNRDSMVILMGGGQGTGGQNDAGSGHDASDEMQGALPLNPGTYSGLLEQGDDYDWYSFDTHKGQIISVDLAVSSDIEVYAYLYASGHSSSSGSAHAVPGKPGRIEYVASKTGTWYIKVKRDSGEGNYTLRLAGPSCQASQFNSNGETADGWSWLQDAALQQFAEWEFGQAIMAFPRLAVKLTLLASGVAPGTTEVHFLLVIGVPGTAAFRSQEVSLPVVGPGAGAAEVRLQGVVQISLSSLGLTGKSNLFFRVQRISPDSPKIAARKDSLIIQPAEQGAAPQARLLAVPADDFHSNGDSILGVYWCRKQGHFLEWTWKPISEPRAIVEVAVNLELLVTNKVNGGSGWGTTVEVTLLDPAGTQVASGQVELTNPFRPRFPDDTHGIGYKTYGVFVLPDPNLVRTGFRLRIAWPPSDGSGFHFGGAKDRALLALVAAPQGTAGATMPSVHVQDILSDPRAYLNQRVELVGKFYGWQGAFSCSPITKSDWSVGEAGVYIDATGPFPEGLSPWDEASIGKSIVVVGTVRIKTDPGIGPCPYIEVEEAWPGA